MAIKKTKKHLFDEKINNNYLKNIRCDKMKKNTKLSKFQKEMEPAKEMYTQELENFAKKFDDSIGKMKLKEEPDIDTMDYIYSFEKMNGATTEELEKIQLELYDHMEEFSKANGITKFYQNARIWL